MAKEQFNITFERDTQTGEITVEPLGNMTVQELPDGAFLVILPELVARSQTRNAAPEEPAGDAGHLKQTAQGLPPALLENLRREG